jgi:hypothetical protein
MNSTFSFRSHLRFSIPLLLGAVIFQATSASISLAAPAFPTNKGKTIKNRQVRFDTIKNQVLTVTGKSLLTITASSAAIQDSTIQLNSSDAWIVFPNIKPSVVADTYLKHFKVSDAPAKLGENVRITTLATGAALIPHSPKYAALETFSKPRFRGDTLSHVVHEYYRSSELGSLNDQMASFKLKHGYMATFAENANGTGASKVFIAADKDLEVSKLPPMLKGKVSFVRVFPWNWTSKKGFGGNQERSQSLATQWRYDWSAGGKSTLDIEYVPMRHNRYWDAFQKINQLENVTAVLGFNEPMQKDQANMTVEQCLELWPKLMESGLRIGSIAPTDGGRSLNYLYEFIDKADARGLRVDFVAVHCYHGNKNPKKWVEWLKKIHLRTGRPIWVTEFNNGARWVKNHDPSLQENAKHIKGLIRAMDAAPFVERYAIFNLGDKNHNRQLFKEKTLTPAGEMYRRHKSPLAISN